MRTIADAGIKVGIGIAPIIPGYNESDIPEAARTRQGTGATRAFMSMLHLDTDSIEEYFVEKNERASLADQGRKGRSTQ